MNLIIVIPAYNESKAIPQVLKDLPKRLGKIRTKILVVDDGSTDETAIIAKKNGVSIIKHIINRGAGAATKTGLLYAKKNKADIMITIDADGQHNPEDIQKIIKPIINHKADLVIGSRLKKRQKMPLDRLAINWFANIATVLFFGVFSTDSQSGLKAFSKKAINSIDFRSDRMEFSSEILLEAKRNNLRVKEVPIQAIYTTYSIAKGQKHSNAIPIVVRFMVRLLR